MKKIKNSIIIIFLGIICGMLWFRYVERFNQKKMTIQCWEKLHYYNKEKAPLIIVHLKSIIAGIILIILGYISYKHKDMIIIFIGSAIIGLHIFQAYNEYSFINATNHTKIK